MAAEQIDLFDFSAIPGKYQSFCAELQKQIVRDTSGILCLNLRAGRLEAASAETPDEDEAEDEEQEEDKEESGSYGVAAKQNGLTVFRQSGRRVHKFAGILFYKQQRVVIHSRFDTSEKDCYLEYALERLGITPRLMDRMQGFGEQGVMDMLLPMLFLQQLRSAFDVGVYRRYQTFLYNDSDPKGHLNISRHIRLNPTSNGRVAYSTREYTQDNPINRLILAAYRLLMIRCADAMRTQLDGHPELYQPIEKLSAALGVPDIGPSSLRKLMRNTEGPVTHPMHRNYELLRVTSRLILQCFGLNPFSGSGQEVSGILIPMDRLWEQLLESRLLSHGVDAQGTLPILEGRRVLKSDLLSPWGVLDAKYRESWEKAYQKEQGVFFGQKKGKQWQFVREDVFQVISYMYIMHRSMGGVVFPLRTDRKALDAETAAALREAEPLPFQIHKSLGAETRFWLFPLPLPSGVQDQEQYNQEMDRNLGHLVTRLEEKGFLTAANGNNDPRTAGDGVSKEE